MLLLRVLPPKFNSSPLKSYRNPIGKDRFPTIIFQGFSLLNFGGVTATTRITVLFLANSRDAWISSENRFMTATRGVSSPSSWEGALRQFASQLVSPPRLVLINDFFVAFQQILLAGDIFFFRLVVHIWGKPMPS